jgi:hypothetical protein
MVISSAEHDLEDWEFQSAREVCAEGATCPNSEGVHFVDDEVAQGGWRATTIRAEATLNYDVSSGTYQMDQDDVEIVFVNSPFDELYERLPDKDKIDRSLVSVSQNTKLSYAQRLADRLRELYESVLDDPDEGPLTPGSLINFIYFISETPGLKYPEVTLTPTNEIRAQWTTAPNRHFAVSFSSFGDARFVIFKPGSNDPDRIDRLSGITAVSALIENTKPYRVLEWVSE